MNNDVYNNKKGSSLEEAYAKLREAQAVRNASANQQQYDTTNGVALNTTPFAVNRQQATNVSLQGETQQQTNANWLMRTVGTVDEALRNVGRGVLKLGEGVVDAHLAIAGIFDKEWAENAIKFDVVNALMEWEAENASLNALYKNKTGKNLYDESWLNDAGEKVQNIAQSVEQGIGNALGFMAFQAVPYANIGLQWSGSSGMALEEQFNDPNYNGNYYGSWGSAFIKGGVETGLEHVLGWSPKKMGVSTKTFKNVVKSLAKDFAEEGLEEVASDVITPFFDGMYTDKTLAERYENTTFESLAETFLVGGITGAIMSGAGEVSSAIYLSPEGQKIAHEINENEEWYKQAYEDFKNNPNEQKALEEFNKVKEQVANNLKALGERTAKLSEKYQDRLSGVVTIDGEKVKLKDALELKSEATSIADPRKMAIKETFNMIDNSNIKELADYKVEFVTSKDNGWINTTTKTIHINLNSEKAAKFILGHEMTHAFETNSEYEKIYDEILTSLKQSKQYDSLYKEAESRYAELVKNKSKEAKQKYIEQELVADYIGDNFKNFAEIQKLFTKQSTWDKFKDLVKSLRKENKSSKAKEYYQRFLKASYNTVVEEKKQPSKAVAYSKSDYDVEPVIDKANDIRYSKGEALNKQPKAKLVAQLKDGKVYDVISGQEVIDLIETALLKDSGDVIVFKENREKLLTKINELLNLNNVGTKEFDQKVEELSQELVGLIRISVETEEVDAKTNKKVRKYITPTEYLGIPAKDVNKYLSDRLQESIQDIAKLKGKDSLVSLYEQKLKNKDIKIEKIRGAYTNFINNLASRLNDVKNELKIAKAVNVSQRKAVLKINTLKYWSKINFDPKANYDVGKIERYAKQTIDAMSKLSFDKKGNVDSSYVNVISALYDFYNNKNVTENEIKEKINNTKQTDADIRDRIEQSLQYFVDKINEANKVAQQNNTTPSYKHLDADGKIQNNNYPLLEGENEAKLFADLLGEVRRMVNKYNGKSKATLEGKEVVVQEVAQAELKRQEALKRMVGKNPVLDSSKNFMLSLVDVKTYMTIMAQGDDESLMMKLYEQLFMAQNKTYAIERDLLSGIRKFMEDKNNKKLLKKLDSKKHMVKFLDTEMTLGEAISLYKMMETDNAPSHLMKDGVEFEVKQVGTLRAIRGSQFLSYMTEDAKTELEMIQSIQDTSAKKLTQEQLDYLQSQFNTTHKTNADLNGRAFELKKEALKVARAELKKTVGNEFEGFIDLITELYSKSGKYYQEATEKIYGFSFTPKQVYYPTKSVKGELSDVDSLSAYVNSTLNPSFTKKVTGKAGNALYVGDVLNTALQFSKTLSMYAGVTVEIKNVNKFLNAEIREKGKEGSMSITKYLSTFVESNFKKRMDGLFKAMQGIRSKEFSVADKAFAWLRKMRAKTALGANLKTILTQFSAYPKAWFYINSKNLTKALQSKTVRTKNGLKDFDYAMQNSSLVNNRYQDNNVYNIESVGALSNLDKFTEATMKPIEFTDKVVVARIWYACQYQCMENGVVNLDKALKLFDQVVMDTQAQYNALGNGSITRIENEFVKDLLMFGSESRKTLSRFVEAIYLVSITDKNSPEHKQAVKYLAKNCATTLVSAMSVSMLSALLKGLKGDYDDEEKEEIIKDILVKEFGSQIVGMIPILSNLYNTLVNGYELQLGSVTHVNDLLKVFTDNLPTLMDIEASDSARTSALLQTITKIGQFFGVPVKNIYNDLAYFGGTIDLLFDTDIALKMRLLYYNTSNAGLNTYLKTYNSKGKTDKVAATIQLKFKNYISGEIDDASAKEMARLYAKGVLTSFPSQITNEMTYNGETITLTKAQKSHAQEIYGIANDILPTMLKSSLYATLSDEEKAKAIDKLFDTYYDLAKQSLFADYEVSKFGKVANYVKVEKFAVALAKINSIAETKTATRKVMVQRYINSLSMKVSEKYLLLYLAGYSLDSDKQAMVISYLRQNGMTYRQAKEFMV